MQLFKYKYDKDNSPLRLEFDYDTNQFVYYYGQMLIPIEELNLRSRNALKKENEKLITNPEIIEYYYDLKRRKERRAEIQQLGISLSAFEALGATGGTMSERLREYFDGLLKEEDILLGIHRVGDRISKEGIADILENGLLLSGHLDGATRNTNTLSNNISFYEDNATAIKELMYANLYKDSPGSILVRVPLYDLEEGIVYKVDQDYNLRLNPFYIIGYIPVENNHIETIMTIEDIKKQESTRGL